MRLSPHLLRLALALLAACASDDATSALDPDAGVPLESLCEPERDFFRTEIHGGILSVQCIGCHNGSGPAAHTRLLLQLGDDDATLAANLAAVHAVASVRSGDRPLLLTMPSDTDPMRKHPGGRLLPTGGDAYAQLAAFTDALLSEGCDQVVAAGDCGGAATGPRVLRRLTPAQYDRSVRDLTGLDGAWGSTFPADPRVDGFDNAAADLHVSPLLADKLQAAAEDIAARVELDALLPCPPDAPTDGCDADFVRAFGRRAFRRPLSDADVERYLALYPLATDFAAGSRLVVTAMLQSPHFLYRFELGGAALDGVHALDPHELATELSYLVTGSMPDAALREAADSGALSTPDGLRAEALRLLQTPAARQVLRDFAFQWLGLDRLPTVPKDAATFPGLTPEVRAAMAEEADALLQRVVFDGDGSLPALLTAPLSTDAPALADFYGAETGATLPGRRGLLTLGGVMLTHARSNDSSPIHRGKLVRERLLCQVPPPPPPGINAEPPPLDPMLTGRERYAAHSSEEPCKSCHRLMDPIGFAFEHFDGVGRYRETDNGLSIDASGEIVSTPATDASFEGTDALADLLADSADVHACFATQWFRYASGLTGEGESACARRALQGGFVGGSLSVRELVLQTVASTHFLQRAEHAPDGDPGDGDGDPGDGDPGDGDPGDGDPGDGDPGDGDGDGGGDGDDGTPSGPARQAVSLVQNDTWATGYCHTYEVRNDADTDLAWVVTLVVQGNITHAWEAEYDGNTGEVRFTGLAHNAALTPGGATRFGFCADL